ncbi:MAG: helix-turn-helix domain-containing protein [Rufibacter sp.]
MSKVNFNMLTLAREARGLTQSELVEKVPNLTQGNYSRMEKGLLNIPEETLSNISKILKFPISFFFNNNPIKDQAEYFYRKRLTMPRKQQIKIEANFDLLRIWIEALLTDVDIPDFNLPCIEVEGTNTPAIIASKIRNLMGLQKGPTEKLIYQLEKNGILVYCLKDAPEKFDGTTIVTNTGQHIIVINDALSNDRKRFTIAHEFGHIVMHLPFTPILDPDRDVELEANAFASEFLMPEIDIRRDLINLKFSLLGDLKAFWKVSKAAIIRRALDLKFIDKSKYTSMMIELSRLGERKKEKNDVEIDHPVILPKILATYIDHLNYTHEELLNFICISQEDFDYFLLGTKNEKPRMRIVI